ncbi:MAG: ubiquinone/menaquinone biosynthesis methyltransferase [Thermodesulfobacterium sp.]|jgi:demethylmenaquinone methyltransferase/2-methoxy-6-polyprenyl-1,4-benzoquinol methylase|nr:ubiquinone/menaquinone biosynthesis methyltransferase [Thermodesulfobacterium sp.]
MDKSTGHKDFMKDKFGKITRYYDLANSICSFWQDKGWRKEVSQALDEVDPPILDLCCGPYTLTLEILKRKKRIAFALDLSREMLKFGLTKRAPDLSFVYPVCGDAEELPFKDETFGAVTIAFGFRNLVNRDKALHEMHRVLKKDGLLAILEFSKPKVPIIRNVYFFYLKKIIPIIGGLLTGDYQAYRYLATSIENFPEVETVREMLRKAGFSEVFTKSLTFGVVTLYLWRKI